MYVCHVLVDRNSGPVPLEDSASVSVALTEEGVSKPSSGESEIKAADAREEAADT
jgi:hypothetical protein